MGVLLSFARYIQDVDNTKSEMKKTIRELTKDIKIKTETIRELTEKNKKYRALILSKNDVDWETYHDIMRDMGLE